MWRMEKKEGGCLYGFVDVGVVREIFESTLHSLAHCILITVRVFYIGRVPRALVLLLLRTHSFHVDVRSGVASS